MAFQEQYSGQLHSATALLATQAPPPLSGDRAAAAPSASQSLTPQGSSSDLAEADTSSQCSDPEHSRTNLIINYVPSNMTQDNLRSLFEGYGEIKSCKLMMDRASDKSLGYGFVDYAEPEAAQAAIDAVNGMRVGNKMLKVSIARPSSATITNANLYVKGLPHGTEEVQLKAMFAPCGDIISVRVLREADGSPKGVGFVRFDQRSQAEEAIRIFHGTTQSGSSQTMIVKFADNAKSRANSTNMSMAAMMSAMPPSLGYGYMPTSPTLSSPTGPGGFPEASIGVPQSAVTPQGICLFVYNLPADVTEDHLRVMCQPYAHVTVSNIIRHRDTGASKGYGFVTVTTVQEAMGVIESLNGSSLQGRNLQVSFKTERRRSGSNASMTPPHYMTAVTSQPMSPYAMAPHPYSPYGGGSPPTHGIYGMQPHSPVSPQMNPYGWAHATPPQHPGHPGMMSPPTMPAYTMMYEQPQLAPTHVSLGSMLYTPHSPTALGQHQSGFPFAVGPGYSHSEAA